MVRWITEFLGTGPFTKITPEGDMRILDVRDLVDKAGNDPSEIVEKIDAGIAVLNEGCRLVVACDYGISRSNSIAAGILSVYENIPFDEAAYTVVQTTGEQEIKLGPLGAVRRALKQDKISNTDTKNILVTGGTGFVGKNFISQFKDKYSIFAPTREEIDLLGGATILDLYIKKNQITHIVHLANPRIYTSDRAVGETITILKNILGVFRENNLHLTFPSIFEVYLGHDETEISANENTTQKPKGPYAETKWLCENLINLYREKYDLKCTILRSSLLYGEGADKPKFIWDFISKAEENEPIFTHLFKNNKPAIDILHVSDFCKAIAGVLEKNTTDDFNLGGGTLWETEEIAQLICKNLRSKSEVNHRLMDRNVVKVSMDYTLATEKIGWQPTISVESGIELLIKGSKS